MEIIWAVYAIALSVTILTLYSEIRKVFLQKKSRAKIPTETATKLVEPTSFESKIPTTINTNKEQQRYEVDNENKAKLNSNVIVKSPEESAKLAYEKLISDTKTPYLEICLEDMFPGIFESKVGGIPYLPKNAEIPLNSQGKPMKLLAQIDCKELNELSEYPHEGILQFWLTTVWPWEEYKVIYHKEIDRTIVKEDVLMKLSEFIQEEKDCFPVEGEYGMKFSPKEEAMSRHDNRLKAIFCQFYNEFSGDDIMEPDDAGEGEFGAVVYNIFGKYCDNAYGMGHKIGGYKGSSQHTEYYESRTPIDVRSDESYMLLFQLDSDYAMVNFEARKHDWIKVMWGDSGIGNFSIKRSDLKNCNFSNVLFQWDCS